MGNRITRLLLFAVFTIFCLVTVETDSRNNCYWSGTAPICQGGCKTGEYANATSRRGDGLWCLIGRKTQCCKASHRPISRPLSWRPILPGHLPKQKNLVAPQQLDGK